MRRWKRVECLPRQFGARVSARGDTLANAERPAGDRPVASADRLDPHFGYWPGSATGHVEHWRQRALAAEAEVRRMRELQAATLGV